VEQVVPFSTQTSISLLANVHLKVAATVPAAPTLKSVIGPVQNGQIAPAPVVTVVVTGAGTGVGAGAEGLDGVELPPQPPFNTSAPNRNARGSLRFMIAILL
jgi:hypothetical protein